MKKYIRIIICCLILFFISFASLNNVSAAPTEEQCNELTCFCDSAGANCKLGETATGNSNVPYTVDKCGCTNTYTADDVGAVNYSVCNDERVLNVFRIVGYIIVLAKIVAPLLLIIFGIVDLSKAVIAGDDKAISNSVSLLAKKAIAGVVIFFIPTIVDFVYSMVNDAKPIEETFMKCQKCLVDPKGQICTEGMKDYEDAH